MRNLIIFLCILFVSCDQQQEIIKEESLDFNKPIEFRSELAIHDFSNFEDELLAFWQKGLELYSLETFCSCECDGVYAAQDMVVNYRDLLPSIFTSTPSDYSFFEELGCEDLKNFMSIDCQFSSNEEYLNFIIETLQSSGDAITDGETALVLSILDDISNNELDVAGYRESWYNLEEKSSVDNYFSAIIIEIASSGTIFLEAFGPQNGEDEIHALWHKVGGAALGAVIALGVRVGYCGIVSGSDIVDTLAMGAISGAIRSW
jgi:hypothetical protein